MLAEFSSLVGEEAYLIWTMLVDVTYNLKGNGVIIVLEG